MREDKVFLLDHLRSELSKSVPLCLESGLTFWSCGVKAKDDSLILVSVCEGVEKLVSFALIVLVLEHVASMPPPGGLRYLVVEES